MQPAPLSPPPARSVRPGRGVLAALITEAVLIGGADNQWVAQRVSDHALDHQGSFGFDLAFSLLTYQWRFAPTTTDVFHSLYGQWALLAVVLMGTALLVLGVARGPATFSRVLFGTWLGVIALTGVGAIVRGLIADSRLEAGQSRAKFALFGALGPQQFVFFGGLVLGLLVGLAAAIAAVTGASSDAVAAGAVPGAAAPAGGAAADSQPTTQLPPVPAQPGEEQTQVLPVVDE